MRLKSSWRFHKTLRTYNTRVRRAMRLGGLATVWCVANDMRRGGQWRGENVTGVDKPAACA